MDRRMLVKYLVSLPVMMIVLAFGVTSRATQPALDTGAIDRFIAEQMAAHRVPGLALAITRGDKALYVKGYGAARDHQPVTPQTQFFIASLSKSFTALAVMQLAEDGRINLDAPVQTYLPEFTLADSARASQITIRHLLNQTSGLSDAGFPENRLPQPATVAERVASLRTAQAVAAPGVEFHYFNPNYGVLARVVEVVSGRPFPEYLHAQVFAPLQMSRTFSVITSADAAQQADRLAQGHLVAFGIPFAYPEMSGYLGGSGGVISTAEDLAHYLIMQNNGGRFAGATLLSPTGVALMHSPPRNIDGDYAMGWFEKTAAGTRVIEHNGILSTFYAEALLLPETGHGLALLYNVNSLSSSLLAFPRIKSGLIALLVGRQPASGGLSVRMWGMILAALTLISVGLAIRSLLRLRRSHRSGAQKPRWRLWLGIGWAFLPALVLLALPWPISLATDRVFGYEQLCRSMPDIVIWLACGAALGAFNGIARIVRLAWR